MSTQTAHELHTIRNMPYGTARIAAAEAISRRIEADGPRDLLATALLDLVEAYTFAAQGEKSFVAFARALRLWDESPELFGPTEEHNLFWEFKWVAADLPEYPQITTTHAEAFLADMERRFDLAGHGSSSVRLSRFRWAWHTGQNNAEEMRLHWLSGVRDGFEDCAACTVGQQVSYFADTGRHREAVDMGLSQRDSCNQEPVRTHFATALSALQLGDAALAHEQYRRALASDDGGKTDFPVSRAQGFQLLACGGQFDRALRVLRNDLAASLRTGENPMSHLKVLICALAGLSANLDRGDEPSGFAEPEWATVASLHAWVTETARGYARPLDARNGNDRFARRIEDSLTTTRSETPLPDTAFRPAMTQPSTAEQHGAAEQPGNSSQAWGSGEDRFGYAETLLSHGQQASAAQAYVAAAQALEQEGWIARSGLALAEAAQCSALENEDEAAHDLFAAALPRLATGGADAEIIVAVLAAWAPIAARMQLPQPHIAATEEALARYDGAEPDTSGMAEELAARRQTDWQRQRASLRDTLARSLAAAGLQTERAIAEALRAGEEYAGTADIFDAAHAFWVAGLLQRDAGHTEDAIWSLESAYEGFTVARHREQRANAASDLIELLRQVGHADRADEVIAEL